MTVREQNKEAVIGQALAKLGDQSALAKAMVAPVLIPLQYQGIGRKLLLASELPPIEFLPDDALIDPNLDTYVPEEMRRRS